MIAAYPLIEVPTGRSEFGPDRSKPQTFLPIWMQYATPQWTTYGGIGYRINPVRDGRDSVFTGAAALYRLNQTTQIGAELFNETSTTTGEQSQTGFNIATIIALADDYNFLFSVGKGLRNVEATNQFSFYCALQVQY
ncbi:conserved hypothetical protein [Ricinus communis]|uniref:Uncharacterized protein n=1 Tax=Ricinus communis TaxID=3988 RepID=B9TGQ1_RICCO|nr:conserved hypothetical protein [Ricinus communis]